MPRLTRLWQSATPLGRFAFVVAVLASTLYAGTKTNDVGSAGNSGTNRLMYVLRRLMPSDVIQPALTPSNAVEVAIGTDADGDGNLSVEESAYAFGYDCGAWFCRDTALNRIDVLGRVPDAASAPANRLERTFVLKRRKMDTAWNLAKVTRRGSAPICEQSSVRGYLPGLRLSIQ